MSRSYRLRVPLALLFSREELQKKRLLRFGFDLLGILEPARMKELLESVLSERGWTKEGDVWKSPSSGPVQVTIDPEKLAVQVDASAILGNSAAIWREGLRKDVDLADSSDPTLSSLNEYEIQLLKDAAGAQGREVQAELLKAGVAAKRDLSGILKDVYRLAVKEKAGKIGNIASVTESSEGSTLRIRIEIDS